MTTTQQTEQSAKIQTSTNGKRSEPMPAKASGKQKERSIELVLRDAFLSNNPLTVYGLGDWLRYDNGLWKPIHVLQVKQEMTDLAEVFNVSKVASTTNSAVDLVQRRVYKPSEIFDANPDYLVCGNGTLHIPGKILDAHNPALYATTGVGYDYDPAARADAWQAFLFDLAEGTSQGVVDFLQEYAGYGLTVDTQHELAVWLFGPPGSGKSTFLTGLEAMLCDRAGLLGLADIERSRFALANLPGKTLAIATEQPGDYIASTNILNAIISGETITVDRKYRDQIEVTSRAKLCWAMNELPRVSDPNSGIFRRVKVVNFPVIPEPDRDPELKERIKTEGAGILNWALAGLDRLRQRGRFNIPAEVTDATESFKNTNDIPAQFVEDSCVTGTDENGDPYRAQTSQLYNAYKQWCIDTGHKPQSSTSIATDWKRLGFEKRRPGGVVYWFNVGLKA